MLVTFKLGLLVLAEECPGVELLRMVPFLVVCRLGLVKLIPGLSQVVVVEVDPVL